MITLHNCFLPHEDSAAFKILMNHFDNLSIERRNISGWNLSEGFVQSLKLNEEERAPRVPHRFDTWEEGSTMTNMISILNALKPDRLELQAIFNVNITRETAEAYLKKMKGAIVYFQQLNNSDSYYLYGGTEHQVKLHPDKNNPNHIAWSVPYRIVKPKPGSYKLEVQRLNFKV